MSASDDAIYHNAVKRKMSALEVTWSDDWDVSQVDSKESLPSTFVVDSANVNNNSLGMIEHLWFFSENKITIPNGDSKEDNAKQAELPDKSFSPLELNIHCFLSSTSPSIHILCSAKFIELFTFICEPNTENIQKSFYLKTSRGQIPSSFPSREHLYLHEIVLPSFGSATADGIQLKFLSLNLSIPLPEALLSQEPHLHENHQKYRIIHVAKIELLGMKKSSIAPTEKINTTTSIPIDEQNSGLSCLPAIPPKDMTFAMMMAAMSSRQGHPQPLSPFPPMPLAVATVAHSSSQQINNQTDRNAIDNANSIDTISNDSNNDSDNRNKNNNINNNLVPQHMHLLQIQQMLQQMQHQLLSQLSEQITLACQPLHQRMRQLEAKIDYLSLAFASNHSDTANKEDKDNSLIDADHVLYNSIPNNIVDNCDNNDISNNHGKNEIIDIKNRELALLQASYAGIVRQLDTLTENAPYL